MKNLLPNAEMVGIAARTGVIATNRAAKQETADCNITVCMYDAIQWQSRKLMARSGIGVEEVAVKASGGQCCG